MEIFVEIQENVRGEDVFVLQSTSFPANDHLMELLICIDALRRSSAKRITAVVPYFGYARQDRKPGPRTPISAKLVANLITRVRQAADLAISSPTGYAVHVDATGRATGVVSHADVAGFVAARRRGSAPGTATP